jgi:hypothetical protein
MVVDQSLCALSLARLDGFERWVAISLAGNSLPEKAIIDRLGLDSAKVKRAIARLKKDGLVAVVRDLFSLTSPASWPGHRIKSDQLHRLERLFKESRVDTSEQSVPENQVTIQAVAAPKTVADIHADLREHATSVPSSRSHSEAVDEVMAAAAVPGASREDAIWLQLVERAEVVLGLDVATQLSRDRKKILRSVRAGGEFVLGALLQIEVSGTRPRKPVGLLVYLARELAEQGNVPEEVWNRLAASPLPIGTKTPPSERRPVVYWKPSYVMPENNDAKRSAQHKQLREFVLAAMNADRDRMGGGSAVHLESLAEHQARRQEARSRYQEWVRAFLERHQDKTLGGPFRFLIDRRSLAEHLRDAAIREGRLQLKWMPRPGPELDNALAPIFDVDPDWCLSAAEAFVRKRKTGLIAGALKPEAIAGCSHA